jgi:hypothetical protein
MQKGPRVSVVVGVFVCVSMQEASLCQPPCWPETAPPAGGLCGTGTGPSDGGGLSADGAGPPPRDGRTA